MIEQPGIVMRQQWHDLLFLHWPVASQAVQRLLPPGLTVDYYDGQAYVGLVPFWMSGVTLNAPAPAVSLPNFCECNVRTYVHLADGSGPGVWFFSLDAGDLLAVAVARAAYALPYFPASITIRHERPKLGEHREHRIHYLLRRRLPIQSHPAACSVDYSVGIGPVCPAAAGSLQHFLVERYRLYCVRRGQLYSGRVRHNPYAVEPATLLGLDESLITAAGVGRRNTSPLAFFARRVVVEVEGIRPVAAL